MVAESGGWLAVLVVILLTRRRQSRVPPLRGEDVGPTLTKLSRDVTSLMDDLRALSETMSHYYSAGERSQRERDERRENQQRNDTAQILRDIDALRRERSA